MKVSFVIGRFQPFHNGHKYLIDQAFKQSDIVIVFIGSVQESRTFKNPYTFEQRRAMILDTYSDKAIKVVPLLDNTSDELWVKTVKEVLKEYEDPIFVTFNKDSETEESNNLLSCFKTINIEQDIVLNATDIREKILVKDEDPLLLNSLPYHSKIICDNVKFKIVSPDIWKYSNK